MTAATQRRAENLAWCFQELLTTGERLRSGRQAVQDAESFRYALLEALGTAAEEARRRGYTGDDIKMAEFALVAFLDESILSLNNPVFGDWPRRTLTHQRFQHHEGGVIFFEKHSQLLARDETHETADLLEVYYLCMLLGFAGKYSMAGKGELKLIVDDTGERIRRIRRLPPEIAPAWELPGEPVRATGADPVVRKLIWVAAASLLLAIVLFGVYKFSLSSGVGRMEGLAQVRS